MIIGSDDTSHEPTPHRNALKERPLKVAKFPMIDRRRSRGTQSEISDTRKECYRPLKHRSYGADNMELVRKRNDSGPAEAEPLRMHAPSGR